MFVAQLVYVVKGEFKTKGLILTIIRGEHLKIEDNPGRTQIKM